MPSSYRQSFVPSLSEEQKLLSHDVFNVDLCELGSQKTYALDYEQLRKYRFLSHFGLFLSHAFVDTTETTIAKLENWRLQPLKEFPMLITKDVISTEYKPSNDSGLNFARFPIRYHTPWKNRDIDKFILPHRTINQFYIYQLPLDRF
jgi:hypothetical protein